MRESRFKKICIFGATSAIAQSLIHRFVNPDVSFVLFGRNLQKLEIVRDDILSKCRTKVFLEKFDPKDFSQHKPYVEKTIGLLSGLDLCIFSYGWLPDNKELKSCSELILENYIVNSYSIICISSHIVNFFENEGRGTLAVISSVASDRGRSSNYYYASAKSSLDTFLEGLRHRFAKTKISIITIKPGLVDSPMTYHLKKNLFFASPETVAKDIFDAIIRNKSVVYTPLYWKYLMLFIKLLPRPLFYNLRI